MRVVIEADAEAVAARAAELIVASVHAKPDCAITFPTGRTPERLYELLGEMSRAGAVSFDRVRAFSLDEYVDLPPEHPQRLANLLRTQLYDPVGVTQDCRYAPDGAASDLNAECARYEATLRAVGGIDLSVLGVGADGHIAFNEPGSSIGSRTRVKTLLAETRRAYAAAFGDPSSVPHLALTMGVGTILEARACLLLAVGDGKAGAVHALVEGPITAQIPASALQLHPTTTVLVCEAAASRLARVDHYREAERAQRELERSA